jgi:hypothetical protein
MSVTKITDDNIASISATKLMGPLPAIDGSALTGLAPSDNVLNNSTDPVVTTNPANGVGTLWINNITGNIFICTDATTDGNVWDSIGNDTADVAPIPPFPAVGDRGVFGKADQGSTAVHMQYISIPTLGNSTNFGNFQVTRSGPPGGTSNGSRGVVGGGYQYPPGSGTYRDEIEYVTIATPGNAQLFGNLTTIRSAGAAAGNETRAVFACGHGTNGHGDFSNVIDYITVATTGNAQAFGNTTAGKTYIDGCASSTRAFYLGGYLVGYVKTTIIEHVTIATTGVATTFGNLNVANTSAEVGACSNGTRAVGFGGSAPTKNIQYFDMTTAGDALLFGELSITSANVGAIANITRAVAACGGTSTSRPLEYVTIATTGNAQAFGTTGNAGDKSSFSGN